MLVDVVVVSVLDNYRLRLRFEDGVEGDVDVAAATHFEGIFEPLREPAYFARVRVDPELGTITWPNGADLDPVVLHEAVQGRTIRVA